MLELYRATLSNGLRVVVHPDRNTAMVALDILYNVGARDENPQLTGMAHLFEHLMFGGSENVPDFDGAVENAGGINNAWTSNDFTNFYTVVPAVNVETAFWVESDRMLAPRLTGKVLEIQRSVVIEEFNQTCLNLPYGDLMHHLRSLAYTTHPYRYPTLGLSPDHVASVSDIDVRTFFDTHYSPSNAVLSVSGNIDPERAFSLAEKYFGTIPARKISQRSYLPEPPLTEARRKIVSGNVPYTKIVMAFPMAAHGSKGYIEADVISDILANGQAARLTKDVVMKGDIITAADASILGSDEPGLLLVSANLRDNSPQSISRAEQLLWEQLDRIATERAGESELKRCTARFASYQAFSQMSYLACAEEIAQAEMQSEDINSRVEQYRAVTADRLRDCASELFDRNRSVTLIYSPAENVRL